MNDKLVKKKQRCSKKSRGPKADRFILITPK